MADKAAKKLIKDMHYEARIQAVIQYHAEILIERLPKRAARSMANSGLAMAQSTRPVLSLSPRFKHGARVLAQ